MKKKLYVICRAGEYYGRNGFWALNIYSPIFFKSEKVAEELLNNLSLAEIGGKIEQIEIELPHEAIY